MSVHENRASSKFEIEELAFISKPEHSLYSQNRDAGNFLHLKNICERELSIRPHNVEAMIFLSISLYELGLGYNAIAFLRASVRQFPKVVELKGNLATLLENDGQWEESYAIATEILHDTPDHFWMYPLLFRLASKMYIFDTVYEIINNGIKHCHREYTDNLDKMRESLLDKMCHLSTLEKYDFNQQIISGSFDVLSITNLDEIDAFSANVWQRFNKGENNKRVVGYLKALSWHPLRANGQYQTFVLRTLYKLDPGNHDLMVALANDCLKRKHFREAIGIVEKYEVDYGKTGPAAIVKCRAYSALQDVQGELKCMEQAICYLQHSDPHKLLIALRHANFFSCHEKKSISQVQPQLEEFPWPTWKIGTPRRIGRPKVALCISGQMRNFRKSYKSWAPLLEAFDVDIYVHTWRSSAKLPTEDERLISISGIPALKSLSERGLVTRQNFGTTLAAIDGVENNVDTLRSFYGAKDVVVEDEDEFKLELETWWQSRSPRAMPPINQSKLWYKIHACNALIDRKTMYEYDYVIRMRIDLEMFQADPGELIRLTADRATIVGMYLLGPEYVGFDDSFWFGSPEVVESAAQAWTNILKNFGADYVPGAPNAYAESVCFYQNFVAGAKMVFARQNLGNPARLSDVFEEGIIGPLLDDLSLLGQDGNVAIKDVISAVSIRKPPRENLKDYLSRLGTRSELLGQV